VHILCRIEMLAVGLEVDIAPAAMLEPLTSSCLPASSFRLPPALICAPWFTTSRLLSVPVTALSKVSLLLELAEAEAPALALTTVAVFTLPPALALLLLEPISPIDTSVRWVLDAVTSLTVLTTTWPP
jgi:hypothetical protein